MTRGTLIAVMANYTQEGVKNVSYDYEVGQNHE